MKFQIKNPDHGLSGDGLANVARRSATWPIAKKEKALKRMLLSRYKIKPQVNQQKTNVKNL